MPKKNQQTTPQDYSEEFLLRLMREPRTRVRDFAGDPRRDPRLVEDLSVFFVPPPTRGKK